MGPGARERPGVETILAGAVSDYFDFLAARPNFVRLIEREALNGAGQFPGASHLSAGQEALAAISAELSLNESDSGETGQLLLSIIALCWLHLIHARTRGGRASGARRRTWSAEEVLRRG